MPQSELFDFAWAQGGAIGLLILAGWALAFIQYKENKQLHKTKDLLLERVITHMHEQQKLLEGLSESLNIMQLIREELLRKRD